MFTVLTSLSTSAMPSLRSRRRDAISSVPETPTESSSPSESKPWVTAVIVVGSALLATAFVAALFLHFRRRGYRQAKRVDPTLSREQYLRARKMSAADRQKEEELQRNIMIRKSLASRSWDWSSHSDVQSLASQQDATPSGLKEDWKEWEARMARERSDFENRHPSSSAVPDLPIPCPSRSRSPSRSPLLRGQSPPVSQNPPQPASVSVNVSNL